MRTRSTVQSFCSALVGLPILAVLTFFDRLPNQIPLHFDENGQADQLGTRQEWLTSLLWSVFLLNFIRILFIRLVDRETNLPTSRVVKLYVSTTLLVTCATLLLIGQGIWKISLYRKWLPVIFFLFGSVFVYYGVPPDLPATPINQPKANLLLAQELANRRRVHASSRLVTIRVNLLVVVLMFFVRSQDRWSVGILANLLVCVYLVGFSLYLKRNVD